MNIKVNGIDYNVDFIGNKLFVNDKEIKVKIKDDELVFEDKNFYLDFYEESEKEYLLIINGLAFKVSRQLTYNQIIKEIKSPMNGQITDILVQNGSEILQGQSLVIVEAMKMYNEIKSPVNGIIKDILVQEHQAVKSGDIILILE